MEHCDKATDLLHCAVDDCTCVKFDRAIFASLLTSLDVNISNGQLIYSRVAPFA